MGSSIALALQRVMGAALVAVCILPLNASLVIFPSRPGQNCLSSARAGSELQFQQWLQGQGLSIESPVSKGMTGMELAACLCGLTVTVAGPGKEGRGPHFKEGGVGSGFGKEQC